jgi:hypothetical protein
LHDAIQFERLGIPATLLITEPFQGLAARFGATLGVPTYPTLIVPHPVSTKSPEQLEVLADRVVTAAISRLTEPIGE